jgi:dissimilatory sulfite reductase (desulfoviridin) alpha/beta subunit
MSLTAEQIKAVKADGFLNHVGTDNFNARIITINGRLTSEQLNCISEAARKFGNGSVEMTTRLTVEVSGIPYDQIDAFKAFIAQAGLYTGGTGAQVRPVVSCKGTHCVYGRIDTFALSEKIHERFYLGYHGVKLPHKFKIAVGGCPNNCVKPNLNDVGIVGQGLVRYNEEGCRGCKKCMIEAVCPMGAAKVGEDGKMHVNEALCTHCGRCAGRCPFKCTADFVNGYKVYIGGRWGKKVSHGIPLSKIFTSEEEVLDVIEKAILLFRDQGIAGERFANTIERLGFENVEKQLLG